MCGTGASLLATLGPAHQYRAPCCLHPHHTQIMRTQIMPWIMPFAGPMLWDQTLGPRADPNTLCAGTPGPHIVPTCQDWVLGVCATPAWPRALGLDSGAPNCPRLALCARTRPCTVLCTQSRAQGHSVQPARFPRGLKIWQQRRGATSPPLPNFQTWEEPHGSDDMMPGDRSGLCARG